MQTYIKRLKMLQSRANNSEVSRQDEISSLVKKYSALVERLMSLEKDREEDDGEIASRIFSPINKLEHKLERGELDSEDITELFSVAEQLSEQLGREEAMVAEAKAAGPLPPIKLLQVFLKNGETASAFVKRNLFGKGGTLRHLPKNRQQKLLRVAIAVLEEETEKYIERTQEQMRNRSYLSFSDGIGITWEQANHEPRLSHLLEAAKNGIFVPDWRTRLRQVERSKRYHPSLYSAKVIRWGVEEIQNTAAKIEKLMDAKVEGLTGKGLEFLPSSIGNGRKVYLNGKLVTVVTEASFSDTPTNGKVLAWVVSDIIDSCHFRGSQMSWKVMAWKQGLKEPKQVFEDNAWAAENRGLMVKAPVVLKDGTIRICVCSDGKESVRDYAFSRSGGSYDIIHKQRRK